MNVGKRGPAPQPAHLRLLNGARERDVNMNEPVPRTGKIDPPPGMAAEARAIFNNAVAELEHMGIASPADADSLACYAEAVANHREASARIAQFGVLVKSERGYPVRNPALIVQRGAAQTIRAFAQEFGLTPSARARIAQGSDEPEADNPFAVAP